MIKLFIILVIIDLLYLKIIGYPLFSKVIKKITNEDINFNYIGLLSYFFIVYGLNYFIIKNKKSVLDAFILGLVIYGTYDFTNIGIFKNYDIYIGLIDTLWGGLLLSITTYIYYQLSAK